MFYQFGNLKRPVLIRSSDPVLEGLRTITRGWTIREWRKGYRRPSTSVIRTITGWGTCSARYPYVYSHTDPVAAVCDCVSGIIDQFMVNQPDYLCLHAGGVEIGGGLVLVSGISHTGKSTLTTHLAHAGGKIWSDDVVPVHGDSGDALALGLMPRLRLPLPDNSGNAYRGYIDRNCVLRSERYGYVDYGKAGFACFGETSRIRGLLILDRSETPTPPVMEPVLRGLAMRFCFDRNFSYHMKGDALVQAFLAALGAAGCYRIKYYRGEDAAALVTDYFGG